MFRDTYSSSFDDTKVDYDEEIKIIVLGETGVGKSNIIIRYGGGQFDPNSVPNNTSSYIVKYYTFGNKVYRINLWDTAGQEKYYSLTKLFVKDTQIALLVYAIDDYHSFEKIDFWYNLIKEACKDSIISIIGNKIDLIMSEKVDQNEGKEKAKKYNAEFGLTSALNDDSGIDEIIENLVKKYIKSIGGSTKIDLLKNNIKIEQNKKSPEINKKKKKGCC